MSFLPMNGMEATRIICAISGDRHVPIVALTASLLEDMRCGTAKTA